MCSCGLTLIEVGSGRGDPDQLRGLYAVWSRTQVPRSCPDVPGVEMRMTRGARGRPACNYDGINGQSGW